MRKGTILRWLDRLKIGLNSPMTRSGDLSRPLGETLMAELVEHASDILAVQARLRALLRANRTIVAELSLATVLRRIVEAAREVAGAKYAALGVIGTDGLLEEFIHIGMDEATVEAIGQLPTGTGPAGGPHRASRADQSAQKSARTRARRDSRPDIPLCTAFSACRSGCATRSSETCT